MNETELKLRHYENLLAILDHDDYEEVIAHLMTMYRDVFIKMPERTQDRHGKGTTEFFINTLLAIPGIDLDKLEPFRWNWPE